MLQKYLPAVMSSDCPAVGPRVIRPAESGWSSQLTIGKRGTAQTFSLPGTGLSYSTTKPRHAANGSPEEIADPPPRAARTAGRAPGWFVLGLLLLLAGVLTPSYVLIGLLALQPEERDRGPFFLRGCANTT